MSKDDVLAVTIKNQHTYGHVGRVAHSSEQINQQVPAVTKYSYYDRLNRLLSGVSDENYGESLTYDKMGNINSLVRTGTPSIAGASGTFAYDYGNAGNQLQSFTNGYDYSRNFQYCKLPINSTVKVSKDLPIRSYFYDLEFTLPVQMESAQRNQFSNDKYCRHNLDEYRFVY